MKGVQIGAILSVIGLALVFVCSAMVEEGRRTEYNRRMTYLTEKYPVYRPPEFAQQLFAPYPPMPGEALIGVGWLLVGVGLLTMFIKLVQKTD